jgi:hypothetical protein
MTIQLVIGIVIILSLPILCIAVASMYIGDWKHPKIDKNWDEKRSRGRINK